MESISYPYSRKSCYFYMAGFIIFLLMSIPNLAGYIRNGDRVDLILIFLFDLAIIFILSYLILKRLLPALQNKTALTIDEQGISSYLLDVTVEWGDMQTIELRGGRSSYLQITFKYDTDYGSRISIPLQWVAGKDRKIYETALAYLENSKGYPEIHPVDE